MTLLLLFGGSVPLTFTEKLELAFGYGPKDAAPVFTELLLPSERARLRSCQVQRGRSKAFDRFDAGVWTGVISNPDGYLTPENTAAPAPYLGNIKPGTPLRYSVNGVVTFYGYTAGFPQSYPGVKDAVVQLRALDAMSLLNRRKFLTEPGFVEALIGQRMYDVLVTELGYPAAICDLDDGTVTAEPSASLIGTCPTDHLQALALAEGGRFFCAKDGKFTFRDVVGTLTGLAPLAGTFRNQAGSIYFRLASDTIDHADEDIINEAAITADSGTVLSASDADSVDDYGERDYAQTWPIPDSDAQLRADHIVYEQKDPRLRIPGLKILHTRCPIEAWSAIDALEIGQRFALYHEPPAGDPIAPDVIVDGVTIDSSKTEFAVSVQLTPADMNRYWLIEVDGYDGIDTTPAQMCLR